MDEVQIRWVGDSAITVDFERAIDLAVSRRIAGMAECVRAANVPGVRDVVPTYAQLAVYFDPMHTDTDRLWSTMEAAVAGRGASTEVAREVVVPVEYGGVVGPDLDDVAAFAGMSSDEVVRLHSSRRYRVFFMGFLPGFPYLGSVDPRISMPRREHPRSAVPAGAVGIAGRQTGIYPTRAPGGWRIIGRTRLVPFDVQGVPPCTFRPGDTVRFTEV